MSEMSINEMRKSEKDWVWEKTPRPDDWKGFGVFEEWRYCPEDGCLFQCAQYVEGEEWDWWFERGGGEGEGGGLEYDRCCAHKTGFRSREEAMTSAELAYPYLIKAGL